MRVIPVLVGCARARSEVKCFDKKTYGKSAGKVLVGMLLSLQNGQQLCHKFHVPCERFVASPPTFHPQRTVPPAAQSPIYQPRRGHSDSSGDSFATEHVEEYVAELCVPCENKLGECPLWDDIRQRLCWLDIRGKRFWQFDPDSNESVSFELPAKAGSFCISTSGEYVFAFEDGFSFYEPETGNRLRITSEFEPGMRTRLNDGKVDRQGRFVVGGYVEKGDEPISGVYRLNADLSVELLRNGVRCSNSICFSFGEDGSMFFTDTPLRNASEILQFPDYTNTDMNADPVVFARPIGRPDGSTLDCEGFLWNAEFGGGRVVRYRPDGTVAAIVKVPVRYTTCAAFGDADLRTLYITDASVDRLSKRKREEYPKGFPGGLFRVRLPIAGYPESKFLGSSNQLRGK